VAVLLTRCTLDLACIALDPVQYLSLNLRTLFRYAMRLGVTTIPAKVLRRYFPVAHIFCLWGKMGGVSG
jgi:hypothetical protein